MCFWRCSSSRIRLPMCICIMFAIYALGYRFLVCFPQPQKRKASEYRLLTAVVENTSTRKDQMLACKRTSAFVFLVALFEIFHVSVRSEQIANAMLIIFFQFVLCFRFMSYSCMLISFCKGAKYFLIVQIFKNARNRAMARLYMMIQKFMIVEALRATSVGK